VSPSPTAMVRGSGEAWRNGSWRGGSCAVAGVVDCAAGSAGATTGDSGAIET